MHFEVTFSLYRPLSGSNIPKCLESYDQVRGNFFTKMLLLMFIREIPNAMSGTVIDVRSREEYDLSHATGAVNIPWDAHLYYLRDLEELPRPWLLCCEEGIRSGWVVLSLKMLGYEEVYNVGRWFDVDSEKAALPPKAA